MVEILRENLKERPWLLVVGIVAWLSIASLAYAEGRLIVAFGVDAPGSFFEVLARISMEGDDFAADWADKGMLARLIVRPFEVAATLVSFGAFAVLVGHAGEGDALAVRRIAWRAVVGFAFLVIVDAAVTIVRYQVIATANDPNNAQAGLTYFAFDALVLVMLGGILAESTRWVVSLRTFVFVGLALLATVGVGILLSLADSIYEPGPFDWSPLVELKQGAIDQAITLPGAMVIGILLAWFAFEHIWDQTSESHRSDEKPERSPGW